jgi:peptidoglycan/xylan/chitin deacetylase (PgdA/CDA1 family)
MLPSTGVAAILVLLLYPALTWAGIPVVFRFDDYSQTCNVQAHEKVIRMFETHGMPCCVAVIPKNIVPDGEAAKTLRHYVEKGVVEPALHGFSHKGVRESVNSEFAGRPWDEQFQLISRGKVLLEEALGRPVSIFVPPWNSYDHATIGVLEQMGFAVLSAGRDQPYEGAHSIALIPEVGNIGDFRSAVKRARSGNFRDPIIVVLLHLYDFVEVKSAQGYMKYEDLDRILDWTKGQEDIEVTTFGGLLASGRPLDAQTYEDDRNSLPRWVLDRWKFPFSLTPVFLLGDRCIPYPVPKGVIVSDRQVLLIVGLGYGLLVCMACVLTLSCLRLARARLGFAISGWAAIVLLAVGLAFTGYLIWRGRPVAYRTASVLAVLAGSFIGSVAEGAFPRGICRRREWSVRERI